MAPLLRSAARADAPDVSVPSHWVRPQSIRLVPSACVVVLHPLPNAACHNQTRSGPGPGREVVDNATNRTGKPLFKRHAAALQN